MIERLPRPLINSIYSQTIDYGFELDFDLLAGDLLQIKEQRKALESKEKKIEEQLKVLCKNMSYISSMYAFVYTKSKGSIDYKRIPEIQGIDLEQYRKEDVYRWILSKQGK